jgi:SAM-dependent methyltransferase
MHFPLRISQTARVRNIDRLSREQARTRYPELRGLPMVEPHIIDDGFHLASLPANNEDFVIANHVLELGPDDLCGLKNWARVLQPSGVLFITVPLAASSFDRGRALTSLGHFLEDHRLVETGENGEFAHRNLEHYREWAAISIPNIAHDAGQPPPAMDAESVEARARGYAEAGEEIHFHTFSVESFQQILAAFQRQFRPDLMLVDMVLRGGEVTGVLQRSDTAP